MYNFSFCVEIHLSNRQFNTSRILHSVIINQLSFYHKPVTCFQSFPNSHMILSPIKIREIMKICIRFNHSCTLLLILIRCHIFQCWSRSEGGKQQSTSCNSKSCCSWVMRNDTNTILVQKQSKRFIGCECFADVCVKKSQFKATNYHLRLSWIWIVLLLIIYLRLK